MCFSKLFVLSLLKAHVFTMITQNIFLPKKPVIALLNFIIIILDP